MLEILQRHAEDDFARLFTDDESWVYLNNPFARTRIQFDGRRPKSQRGCFGQEKMIAAVFINGQGLFLLDVLPEGKTVNSEMFRGRIIYLLRRLEQEQNQRDDAEVMVHYDNARPTTRTRLNDPWTLPNFPAWNIRLILLIQHHVIFFFLATRSIFQKALDVQHVSN
ncbi:MAG: hypothetical protein EZS28_002825 [Streblomastix strix]|uniref:Uncharacterized protein n=1 Tax=Streblomastix strix TaxID=222440 RepID=A0A5J4X545_9EUKA|nr:MAG: hypothetical protein EZS28_002825 [Streblomastix strix]